MKYKIALNGKTYEVEVEETEAVITSVADTIAPVAQPAAPSVPAPAPEKEAAAPPAPAVSTGGSKVLAPMPGTILAINVALGQAVRTGDVLLVLEAMKMENEIVAPSDGTVAQILVQKGSMVDTDAALVVIG